MCEITALLLVDCEIFVYTRNYNDMSLLCLDGFREETIGVPN